MAPPWFQLSMRNHLICSAAVPIAHLHSDGNPHDGNPRFASYLLWRQDIHDRPESLGHPGKEGNSRWGHRDKPLKALTYGRENCHFLNHLLPSAALARGSQVTKELGSLCALSFQRSTSGWDHSFAFSITCRESQRWLACKLSDKLAVKVKVVMKIPRRIIANIPILITIISTHQQHICASHLTRIDIVRWSPCIWSMQQNLCYEILSIYSISFKNLQNDVLLLCFLMIKLTNSVLHMSPGNDPVRILNFFLTVVLQSYRWKTEMSLPWNRDFK